MPDDTSQFSASEPALGYLYQIRYALLEIFRQPEESVCYIEKDDDVDFSDPEEGRILASLKHKAPGDTLTDLSQPRHRNRTGDRGAAEDGGRF